MPIKMMKSEADDSVVERYDWPLKHCAPVIGDALREWRKQAIKDQAECLAAQKLCGREDIDQSKFFKAEARHHLKVQRACTLMLPWLCEPDNGQETVRPVLWPVELVSELDEISNRIYLRFA